MPDKAALYPARYMPGPTGLPLVGSMFEMAGDGFIDFLFRWREKYGELVRVESPAGLDWYFLTHPDQIEQVMLASFRSYEKGILWNKIRLVLGNGLLTSNGELWRERRRVMQPFFHQDRHQAFAGTMVGAIDDMIASWAQFQAGGEPFDIVAEMTRITLHNAGCALLGPEFADLVPVTGADMTMIITMIWVQHFSHRHSFNPKFRGALRRLHDHIDALLERRRSEMAQGHVRDDLLHMLLTYRDSKSGQPLTERELHDEIMTFLFTGHETTAIALGWTWYLLALHPEARLKLEAEVDAVLGDRTPVLEDVSRLQYTRQVFQEALRLYPPVWAIDRENTEDVEIGGYLIPAGKRINILPYVVHRHPDFWESPDAFDPERFAPEQVAKRHRYAYLPFGGGPRLCIGMNFALIESILLVAMVTRRARMELVPGQKIKPTLRPTLRPNAPIYMKLKPRV